MLYSKMPHTFIGRDQLALQYHTGTVHYIYCCNSMLRYGRVESINDTAGPDSVHVRRGSTSPYLSILGSDTDT